jgi:hypothetical protein
MFAPMLDCWVAFVLAEVDVTIEQDLQGCGEILFSILGSASTLGFLIFGCN